MTSIRSASWMLAFAALVMGCSHSSDSHAPDSAAAPSATEASASPADSGPQPATAAEAAVAADAADRAGGGGSVEAETATAPSEKETGCVDAWLEKQGLDRFGSPAGTMYAGGTPLFDERTGVRQERLPFVYKRHPAVKEACQGKAAGQPAKQAQ